tara:strand:- start:261 stop:935 length:675 start_codon:yes stop_codon:yes gene_type:complete
MVKFFMSFKTNKYVLIKEAISKDLAGFIYNYFLMKREVVKTCLDTRFISPFETLLGEYEPADGQIPHTYANYADIAMETLLLKCQPLMEKTTGLKLYPAYTYARIYKKGDILKRHKDRFSCEISTTMNLGGDPWSIYLEPNKNNEMPTIRHPYQPTKNKGIKVDLKPGDMLVYKGTDLEHWRNPFKGKDCGQVFLHYNNQQTSGSKENMFDRRPHLGLPSWFKK